MIAAESASKKHHPTMTVVSLNRVKQKEIKADSLADWLRRRALDDPSPTRIHTKRCDDGAAL